MQAMLSLDDAVSQLIAHACSRVLPMREVPTLLADGCVLRQNVVSQVFVPPLDNSAMDGYALRLADITSNPTQALRIVGRTAAGQAPTNLQTGQAVRIFTGAPIPLGADTVVMQEDCRTELDAQGQTWLHVNTDVADTLSLGKNVRLQGEDIDQGAVVLQAGIRLTPQALGVAAAVGQAALQVSAAPRVALFSTGDELVMPGDAAPQDLAQLRPGAIFNSNRYVLKAMLERLGCVVTDLGTVPDTLAATEAALQHAAAEHDVILTSGGVSVGEEDHIKPAMQRLGQLNLWRVAIKPGKPFAFGTVGNATFLGLPGNPVSSWVTFITLVRPYLLALQGAQDAALCLPTLPMRANFDWPKADPRREFLRVRLGAEGLQLHPNQSSGVLTSAHWATGLVDNPPGQTIAEGNTVRYLPIQTLSE